MLDLFKKIITRTKKPIYPSNAVMVASYPKSGSTWLANLLLCYFKPKPWDFFDYKHSVQEWYGPREILKHPYLTLIKTHQPYCNSFPEIPTIHLIRDPRNVVISYYEGLRKHGHIDIDLSLSEFVKKFIDGIKFDGFGTWNFNVGSFDKRKKSIIWVRYEDLESNSHEVFKKIINFLNIKPVQENLINECLEFCSRDSMRKNQFINQKEIDSLNNALPGFEKQLFTSSKTRDWKDTLNHTDSDLILSTFKKEINKFGYYA